MFVYVCMCEQILETHRVYMMYLLSLCVLKWSPVMPCRMKKSLTTSDLTKRTNALSSNQSMSRISKPWSRLFTSNQSGSLRSSAKSTNNSLFEKNFTKYVTSLFIYGRFKQRRIFKVEPYRWLLKVLNTCGISRHPIHKLQNNGSPFCKVCL